MKVLIFNETAGSSRYWEAAITQLKSRGIDISFASLRAAGPSTRVLEAKGISTFAFDARNSADHPAAVLRLIRLLRRERFDVIHASESLQAATAGIARQFAPKTKCIFHYHHTHVTGVQRACSLVGSKLSDMVMAVSEASRTAAIENDGVSPAKIFVAYNGIEPMRSVSEAEIDELRRAYGIPESARIVTIVGGLREGKGHKTLFEACKLASPDIGGPLHILIVGEGSERRSLEDESSHYREFTTHFVGHQEDVALWFSAADVVAMPSYHESFGLVAVEAMDCGKVVVASDVEGPAEIIENGVNGILVPPRNAAALADAIVEVLADPAAADRIGDNARRRVRDRFTMEKMVDGWIECYTAVLAK